MSGKKNVGDYLRQHEISKLFQELTKKLITIQPENPKQYIITQLQYQKEQKASKTIKSSQRNKSAYNSKNTQNFTKKISSNYNEPSNIDIFETRPVKQTEEEFLSNEFKVASEQIEEKVEIKRISYKDAKKQRNKKTNNEKKDLEIIETNIVSDDSTEGVELLEDEDDLRSEGVFKVNRKSLNNITSRKLTHIEPEISISLCSKCAKIISDNDSIDNTDLESCNNFKGDTLSDTVKRNTNLFGNESQNIWTMDDGF